ncbi:MAG TPA: hypothetical protein DCK93_22075 [Blastocatellia bacterium]|jgi:2-polyprenyl-3-methyl-5-hydroxy-6-metoxy-1,4-benzoquinol methylase|nr:hypothetical protein [Blastocatellia bacterium]
MSNQGAAEPPTARTAYDAWHCSQEVDIDVNTPWHRFIKKYIHPAQDLADRRILEIGCGRGGFSCWLASQQPGPKEVVAADFSQAAVKMGRAFAVERGLSNITWKVADIQRIPFEAETFDTVISCETIEHVPDPRQAVQELARVLKPEGRLFLTTPNYLGVFGLYRIYRRLVGRRFTEIGQPINKLVLLPLTLEWVRRTKLKVEIVDSVELWPFPMRPPRALRLPRILRSVRKWLGVQSFIVARKVN